MGILAASGSDFVVPGLRLSFFRSYSFFIGFRLLSCRLASRDQSNHSPRFPFAENDQQQAAAGRVSDPEKSVFRFAMLRVEEFHRTRVRPDRLRLFKPDPMLTIVNPVLRFVPFKP